MRSPRRGVAALEFMLLLPVWTAVVLAMIEFGWVLFGYMALDASANLGCRAASLVDPGDHDERIELVEQRAFEAITDALGGFGVPECPTCTIDSWTLGEPPRRVLVCRVTREIQPIVGLYLDPVRLQSLQVARLEWQREAAP